MESRLVPLMVILRPPLSGDFNGVISLMVGFAVKLKGWIRTFMLLSNATMILLMIEGFVGCVLQIIAVSL